MKSILKAVLVAGSVLVLSSGSAFAVSSGFTITSTSFADNELMDSKYAGKGGPRNCDGENISPAFAWEKAPEGTKSFAILAHDQVGGHGLGIDHWVLYDIPANVSSINEGEVPAGSRQGPNVTTAKAYLGPCPDVGDRPHHYEFLIMALDVEPGTLPDDLGHDAFLDAVSENSLGATSIVGRYARNP